MPDPDIPRVQMRRGEETDWVPEFAVPVKRNDGWSVVKAATDEKPKATPADEKEKN